MTGPDLPKSDHGPWEVERDRHGVMFSGPLEVGECIRVVLAEPTDEMVERATEGIVQAREAELRAYLRGDVPAHQWRAESYARAALEAAFSTSRSSLDDARTKARAYEEASGMPAQSISDDEALRIYGPAEGRKESS